VVSKRVYEALGKRKVPLHSSKGVAVLKKGIFGGTNLAIEQKGDCPMIV